ncbi:MAG: putative membrane protein [Cenarchaeum symbiont of Oopsacas minuta]|nr:putative membrane protein [Cenarchaeum symbiont of Oopsacas minuta]
MKINKQELFDDYNKQIYKIPIQDVTYLNENMAHDKIYEDILKMVGYEYELRWPEKRSFKLKRILKINSKQKTKKIIPKRSLFAVSACVCIMITASLAFQFPYNLMAVLPFSAPLFFNSKHIWDKIHNEK